MRSVLTISIPEDKKKDLERRAKKAGKTVSAYVVSVLEMEKQMISEDELVAIVKEGMREHKAGKTKLLKSLKDLT